MVKVKSHSESEEDAHRMGTPAQVRTQSTPPAVLHKVAMRPNQQSDTPWGTPMTPFRPAQTCGVTPPVFPPAASAKVHAKDCTTDQLFEIEMDVARKCRTAKEIVAQHNDYILRLKAKGVQSQVRFPVREGARDVGNRTGKFGKQ